MVHTKSHQNQPSFSWKEDFKGFTIYEHDRHLAHVTSIMLMMIKNCLKRGTVVTEKSKFYCHM